MRPGQALEALQVVAVRYRGSRRAEGDERAIDAYAAAGVYGAAGVPFDVVEPAMPEHLRTEDEPANLGRINAAIASAVADGRRAARPVLLTGGDCTHCVGVL